VCYTSIREVRLAAGRRRARVSRARARRRAVHVDVRQAAWVGFAWYRENSLRNTQLTPLTTSSRGISSEITPEIIMVLTQSAD
jgi:hypothetical protein